MAATKRIDEVWALKGRFWLFGGVVCGEERPAREKTNGLRYSGLKETTVFRMRATVGG